MNYAILQCLIDTKSTKELKLLHNDKDSLIILEGSVLSMNMSYRCIHTYVYIYIYLCILKIG
jgi:hypothetical protein